MSKEINKHVVAHYREDPTKIVEFCKVCGKEGLELHQGECTGQVVELSPGSGNQTFTSVLPEELSTEKETEKFVSGLPKDC